MSLTPPLQLISAVAGPPPGIKLQTPAPLTLGPQTAQDFFQQFQNLVRQQRIPEYALIIVLSTALIFLVTSFLRDIVLPPIAFLLSPFDLPDWKVTLRPASTSTTTTATGINVKSKRELSMKIGDFIEVAAIASLLAILAYWLLSRRRAAEDAESALVVTGTSGTARSQPASSSSPETMVPIVRQQPRIGPREEDDRHGNSRTSLALIAAQQKLILSKLEQLERSLDSARNGHGARAGKGFDRCMMRVGERAPQSEAL